MEPIVDRDAVVLDAMDVLARRVTARTESAYEVALSAGPILFPVWETAEHAGAAYVLWANLSDLQDGPNGPLSESVC